MVCEHCRLAASRSDGAPRCGPAAGVKGGRSPPDQLDRPEILQEPSLRSEPERLPNATAPLLRTERIQAGARPIHGYQESRQPRTEASEAPLAQEERARGPSR